MSRSGTKKGIRQQVTMIEVTVVNPNMAPYSKIFAGSSRIQYCGVGRGDHYKVVKFAVYGKPPGQREVENIKKKVQAAGGRKPFDGRQGSISYSSSRDSRPGFEKGW